MHFSGRQLVDNNGRQYGVFYTVRSAFSQLHDGQLRDTQMCHVGDNLSCNAVYRTIIVMQKAHVGQL